MISARVVSVSRTPAGCAVRLLLGPGPVWTEVDVPNVSPEVYDDLRAALCGGKTVTVSYQPGPPPTINGVAIHA